MLDTLRPGLEDKTDIRRSKATSIREELQKRRRRNKTPKDAFICLSDLRAVWHDNGLYKDVISDALTDVQIEKIRDTMLPFVSFVVWIGLERWFDVKFMEHVFGDWPKVTALVLPMTEQALLDIGLPKFEVGTRGDEQYCFIPATVRFHDLDGVQTIDKELRLPFIERDRHALYGGFGKVEVRGPRKPHQTASMSYALVVLRDCSRMCGCQH